ncbi:hypothetical protein NXF25_011544 [Crotalus adamanteus]|uniref:Core shell protein Gag P30 domain-containing protein n=1 Tax=Crotalus adamanteus TaxID=8729 RepID=A0AAW1BGD2_CROAD
MVEAEGCRGNGAGRSILVLVWQPVIGATEAEVQWIRCQGGLQASQPALVPQLPWPSPLRATFDGSPEKLAFFLNQVWSRLAHHGNDYPDKAAQIDVIMDNLEAEAAEWVTILHDEDVPKPATPDALQGSLQMHFGYSVQNQWEEIDIRRIKQGTRPLIKYSANSAGSQGG